MSYQGDGIDQGITSNNESNRNKRQLITSLKKNSIKETFKSSSCSVASANAKANASANASARPLRALHCHPEMKENLKQWRNQFSTESAMAAIPGHYAPTVVELMAGAGCSALFSIRSGFRHLYTTEINPCKARLLEKLTKAPCLGDTFAIHVDQLRQKFGPVDICKSGAPCIDYSNSVPHTGARGDT